MPAEWWKKKQPSGPHGFFVEPSREHSPVVNGLVAFSQKVMKSSGIFREQDR